MRSTLPTRVFSVFSWPHELLLGALLGAGLMGSAISAQSPVKPSEPSAATTPQPTNAVKGNSHRHSKKKEEPPPVVQAPPPPPPPDWPANDPPSPASVVWDSTGLHINASNSSLQQILREVSTETGTKVQGAVSDRRVFGEYGPGKADDVLAQLLNGSGYNFLLAGDLGQGTPREIVLSPSRPAGSSASNSGTRFNGARPQQQAEEDAPEEPEDQPVQPPPSPVQPPQTQNMRPGFGPNGPIRTPQQVMEEMQQRQQQQQQQQSNPPQQ